MKRNLFFLTLFMVLSIVTYAQNADSYRAAANQGVADAQYNLGVCYYNGYGVTKDYSQAVYWFKKAANQGDAEAQYNLGLCYYNGYGVTKDDSQAVYWYKKAANQGVADAQCNLGVCYYNGDGVTKDDSQAVYWYKKAAEQGIASAQYYLAFKYFLGEGVAKDYKKAVYWMEKAAEQDYEDASDFVAMFSYFRLYANYSDSETNSSDNKTETTHNNTTSSSKTSVTNTPSSTTSPNNTTTSKTTVTNKSSSTTTPNNTTTTRSSNISQSSSTTTSNNSASRSYSSSYSYNKYAHWPQYYYRSESMFGFLFAYTQRAIYAKEAETGYTDHYDMFGNMGWTSGFRVGVHYDFNFAWWIGMRLGFFYEMGFEQQSVSLEYYDSYYDLNLNLPVELSLNIPFSSRSGLRLRGGLGFDLNCFAELYDSRDSYVENYSLDYGDGFINRFNMSLDFGVSIHIKGVMFDITYQKGITSHRFAEGYHTTIDQITAGVSFLITDF